MKKKILKVLIRLGDLAIAFFVKNPRNKTIIGAAGEIAKDALKDQTEK